MNTKLLASIAVFALLSGVVGASMMHSVYASDYGMADKKMADKKAKMDTKMTDKKAKVDAKAADAKAKADKKAADAKAKADKKAADAKAKADKKAADMKAKMDAKMTDKKAKMDDKMANARDSATGKATGKAASDVTVEIPKGVASDQNCADKCFTPSTVTVAVGGKVTWKNDDSAAHTATASDGSFDTSMIMAGGSASNTFKTAGSYPYICIVHPWMQGTITVQ